MAVKVIEARSSDANATYEVLRRSIAEVCGPDYGHIEGFIEAWLKNKTPANVAAWIENKASYFVVARVQGDIVGVGSVSRSGEILLCYVVPEYMGKSVGHAILASLESKARQWGVARLTVLSTVTAHTFYTRQGFQPSGPPVMENGYEIEIPMVKEFAP